MSTVRLSYRQQVALLALADHSRPISGSVLAARMTANGRETNAAGAHQAAGGLASKGLAIKAYPEGASLIRYEITNAGRALAAQIRSAS